MTRRSATVVAGPRAATARRTRLAYQVRAAADGEAEILIYDEIGEDWFGEGITAQNFTRELEEIRAPTINVRINSVGGDVFDGLAIYNALSRHPANIITHIDGIAASIASVIALAGKEVRIAENALMMIHNPHGCACGDAAEMRKMAETLDTVKGSLVGIYARRSGKAAEEISAQMDAETWFSATEAKDAGFVDTITEERRIDNRIAAALDVANFAHLPPQLRDLVAASKEPPPAEISAEMVQLKALSVRTIGESLL